MAHLNNLKQFIMPQLKSFQPPMNIKLLSITFLLGLSLIPTLPSYSQPSNPCKLALIATPSNETRQIRVEKFGIAFNIPDNYRTRSEIRGNSIEIRIHDPSEFNYVECLRKNKIPGPDDYFSTRIIIRQRQASMSLTDIARINLMGNPNRKLRLSNISKSTIDNQTAITFNSENDTPDIVNFIFLLPSKKYSVLISSDLVTLDRKALSEMIKSSFTFINR
jgi:hypothetical protein